jgi:hypothetical protein
MIDAKLLNDVRSMSMITSYTDDQSVIVMNLNDTKIPKSTLLDFAEEHGLPKLMLASDGSIQNASTITIYNWDYVEFADFPASSTLYIVKYQPADDSMNVQMTMHGADKIKALINDYLDTTYSSKITGDKHGYAYNTFLDMARKMKLTNDEKDVIAGRQQMTPSDTTTSVVFLWTTDYDDDDTTCAAVIVHGPYSMPALKDAFAERYLGGRTKTHTLNGECVRDDTITNDKEVSIQGSLDLYDINSMIDDLHDAHARYTASMSMALDKHDHIIPQVDFTEATDADIASVIAAARLADIEGIRKYADQLLDDERASFLRDVQETC